MLDMPASGRALWAIFDATGSVRPEYLLPVLYAESGLEPSVQNQAGAPYYGLDQISGDYLTQLGVSPNDYLTWAGSQQLQRVVGPYVEAQVRRYGPLNSGTRVYQANFLPATLSSARTLSSVIASSPGVIYSSNAAFDRQRKGYITVGDLATSVAHAAAHPYVKQIIAETYLLRPGETMRDPTFGTDFGGVSLKEALMLGGAALALASAISYAWGQGRSTSTRRRRARRVHAFV